MASKQTVSIPKESISAREFEILLRRACECRENRKPRLVKSAEPTSRKPTPAA
jgi:hypothetical protein